MQVLDSIVLSAAVLAGSQTVFFLLSVIKNKVKIIDIGWGVGIALTALALAIKYCGMTWLISSLLILWGLRLSLHLFKRNWNGKEDSRYLVYKRRWKKNFWLNAYFNLYLAQGLLQLIIITPLILASSYLEFSAMVPLGLSIWLFGFIFEAIADMQLAQHIQSGSKKIMSKGLWKYSRHPNYFGEVVQWWGIFFMVATMSYGWLAIISPLTISYLIIYVSGIPLLEKKMKSKTGYKKYMQQTSIFIPMRPIK